ncbi:MAG TPA: hypothetical protein VFS19_07390, partial [Planctomycetota bacterium]|nr:hypothetical protein [Planctomycetota bacterium]
MLADFVVNGVLLAADAAILFVLWKKREPKVLALLLVLCGFAAPFLGIFSLFMIGLFASMRVCAWAIFVHGVIVLGGCAGLLWKLHRKTAIAA